MRIAVDASALSGPRSGIARYLQGVLSRAMRLGDHEWTLYARAPLTGFEGARQHADGLSPDLGRIASLFTTQPRWARRDRPDLFWGPAHRLPVGLPRDTARVVTIHDLCWREAPATMRTATRWLDRVLMPRALRQADRIVAVSQSTARGVATLRPEAAERVAVVHEACESLPAPGPRPMTGRYVLCVGTLEPRKNLERLFEAFGRLAGDATLVLAGGRGWGLDAPDALAARHGVAGRVRWLGPVDDATLATWYRHTEFLAMPSLYEGFGLPILEALSQGAPVLYGDNSSMPEVAGDAGLAVDACSVDSIAAGLARLLGDEALRTSLAARAAAQAAKFSWERAALETLAVFDDAVAARRSR